jgi:3-oxoacyl-[acyl-carrier-protein] synthase II
MNEEVVITGMGLVTSIGIGRDEFWKSLRNTAAGIQQSRFEDEKGQFLIWTATLPELSPYQYLPVNLPPNRRLNPRSASRSAIMLCVAVSLAVVDSGLVLEKTTDDNVGIAVGTAFGSLQASLDFIMDIRKNRGAQANTQLFPNTVSNSQAGHAAIVFGIKGRNTTLSTGFSSGLEALREAVESIKYGDVDVVFAGGYDELCIMPCNHWFQKNELAVVHDANEIFSVPFDKQRYGFSPGEGAVVLTLERRSHAEARGATIYGRLAGWSSISCGAHKDHVSASEIKLMQNALSIADVDFADLSCIFLSANGSRAGDFYEAEALDYLAKKSCYCPPVTALKAYIGECAAVAGPASVATALLTLQNKYVPGIPELKNPELSSIIASGTILDDAKSALINSFGLDGTGCSVVVSTV